MLSILIFLPLLTSFTLFFLKVCEKKKRAIAILSASCSLIFICFLKSKIFNFGFFQYYFVEKHHLFSFVDYHVALDSLSFPFIFLSSLLTFLCILYQNVLYQKSFTLSKFNLSTLNACILALESFLFLFFLSQNALTFYIAFEATLIPLFFIIVLFGGKNRSEAAVKFLIYNFLGSLFFIVALIILYNETQTFDIQELTQKTTGLIKSGLLSKKKSCFLFLMIFLSFAIKLPLVPFHGWLPKAHVEAPTTGSVMLAGIVLKMAGFGILRLLLPVFTPINALFSIPFAIFGIASLVVASFLCLSQKHFKKLIAYSSIAHMGYVMIGLSGVCKNRYDEIGTLGAIAQMLSHGLISASLFFCVGMLYERTNTLEIKKLGGIKHSMPFYHGLFFLSLLGAISLPGTSGFIGEFFSIFSFYRTHDFYIVLPSLVLILLCVVLTSFYMLSNYRQIFLQPQVCKNVIDITFNERAILIILLFFMFLIGLYPNALLM